MLLGAGNEHLLPVGADQRAVGRTGPPGASGSTAGSWTRNIRLSGKTGISSRSSLRPTKPPSGRRYPWDTAWTVLAHVYPQSADKGPLRCCNRRALGWAETRARRVFRAASGRRYPPTMRHDDLPGVSHRYLDARGLRMHIAEAGSGPLVLLLHGFPECWYSWRHQLTALAEAGYHAVAPDQRGYCRTGGPADAGPVHDAAPDRRRHRADGRPRRAAGGGGRARLGRAGGLARGAAAPGPGPRRDRAERPVPAAGSRPADRGHARARSGTASTWSTSSSRASPTPSSPGICGRPSPGCSTAPPATRPRGAAGRTAGRRVPRHLRRAARRRACPPG